MASRLASQANVVFGDDDVAAGAAWVCAKKMTFVFAGALDYGAGHS
jgi:hypothetical protein